MSTGLRIPFEQALSIARQLAADLAPHVVRVKAAGSLRRRRPEVGDIELVVEPKLVAGDLFGAPAPDVQAVKDVAARWGEIVKGGDRFIQVQDLVGIEGLKADVFLCYAPAQWGSLLAIRTGPADLGKWAVTRMIGRGYRHVDGHVIQVSTGQTVPTETEEQFFALAGLPFLPPAKRDSREAFEPIVSHELPAAWQAAKAAVREEA